MKHKLHELPEGFIVTSDERKVEGDITFDIDNNTLHKCTGDNLDIWNNPSCGFKKVIARQDQIDFSELSIHDQKKIEWFDVEKLGLNYASDFIKDKVLIDLQVGAYVEGFQKAQELSDRRFTLEDIKEAFGVRQIVSFLQLEQSLSQPKSWEVEIQHVCEGIKREGESCTKNDSCTYPNCGKIKIIKIL
jgi:hypothetical protein